MKKIVFLLHFALIINAQNKSNQSVDMIVHNAKVYTVDKDFAIAEAFAIKDGKFLEIGKNVAILTKYKSSKTINAGGKPVFPGFYDPHSHFFNYAKTLWQANLVGTKSFQEIIKKLQVFNALHPDAEWIIGRGWDQNDWEVKIFWNDRLKLQLAVLHIFQSSDHCALGASVIYSVPHKQKSNLGRYDVRTKV